MVFRTLFLIVAICGWSLARQDAGPTAGDQQNTAKTPDENVSPEQLNVLREFLQSFSKFDVSTARVQRQRKQSLDPIDPLPYAELRVNDGLDGECDVKIGKSDGIIYSYTRRARGRDVLDEPGIRGRTIEDAISAEAAFEAALPILRYYGLPTSPENYTIGLGDVGQVEAPDDLYAALWDVSGKFQHKGVPSRWGRVRIAISAHSGSVISVRYDPLIVPREPQVRISKVEAVQSAKGWLAERKYFVDKRPTVEEQGLERIEEVIAVPNNAYLLPGEVSRAQNDPVQSFYCWEVPFTFVEHEHTFKSYLWVNVETGEVIGAEFRPVRRASTLIDR